VRSGTIGIVTTHGVLSSNSSDNTSVELRTTFSSREELTAYLADQLRGLYSTPPVPNERRGGRSAALEQLEEFRAAGYSRRNYVNASTSKLSAYLRHGILSILEVADHVRQHALGRERNEFLKQLTWHEFFYLVLEQEGADVLENLEPPKYEARWNLEMPEDIPGAQTGLPCVNAWVTKLIRTGYLHNHERLWFAAYVTHWRKIHWRAGYEFFREHLLDGDIASNALSWQWVASTFSAKPYFMNQQNIELFSSDAYCSGCRALCPFQKTYPELERELFGESHGWSS
jgi:deoxyribodipyrimidine photo-lyase